jgi:hypothetical protein
VALAVRRFLLLQKRLLTTKDGENAGNAGAITGGPPGMVEMPAMQEQLQADHHGRWKCR